MDTQEWELRSGLPGSGPEAVRFAPQGIRSTSEGLVVEFRPTGAGAWVGHFHPGNTTFSGVFSLFAPDRVLVIAGGRGYVVDLRTQQLQKVVGELIESAIEVPDEKLVVLSERGVLRAIDAPGVRWTSQPLGYEGVGLLGLDGRWLLASQGSAGTQSVIKIDLKSGQKASWWRRWSA